MASSSAPSSSASPPSCFSELPVVAMRKKIVEKILENRVTVILGETGCGNWFTALLRGDCICNQHMLFFMIFLNCFRMRLSSASFFLCCLLRYSIIIIGETSCGNWFLAVSVGLLVFISLCDVCIWSLSMISYFMIVLNWLSSALYILLITDAFSVTIVDLMNRILACFRFVYSLEGCLLNFQILHSCRTN